VSGDAANLAEEFFVFCDGLDAAAELGDTGPEFARRGRNIARALVEANEVALSEHSCRRALQERIETLEGIVARLHRELDEARRGVTAA
jgi:hypothetical protein